MSLPDRKCPDCNGYGRFMFHKACETCNATGTMTDARYIDALSARVAKLEAALRDATPFVVTSGVGTFTHPRAKANRDAVLWAIHDLLPGTIRAEGIETPRAALEDPK